MKGERACLARELRPRGRLGSVALAQRRLKPPAPLVARDDLLAVELEARQGADRAARGDQDVVGLELVRLAVVAIDLYLLGLYERTGAVVDGHLVLLHQTRYTPREPVDDLLSSLGCLR